MIDDLVADLKDDEGWEPSAYQDHLGFWTLGYGFLVDKRRGGELPKHIGEAWLTYAATQRWNQLAERIPWVLEQPDEVQRALANMAYQLGVNGLLNFKRMLAALKAGDRETAADEAMDSRWAQQTPSRAARVTARIRK